MTNAHSFILWWMISLMLWGLILVIWQYRDIKKRRTPWQSMESAPKTGEWVLVYCLYRQHSIQLARCVETRGHERWFTTTGMAVDPHEWAPIPERK